MANPQISELKVQTKETLIITSYPVEETVNANTLWNLGREVLNHAINVGETCFKLPKQERLVGSKEVNLASGSSIQFNLLKQIACKVRCEAKAGKHFESVTRILSEYKYSRLESAVVSLAAFAMVYGETMLHVYSRSGSAGFASSISLMGVDILIGRSQDKSFQEAVIELNKLTKILVDTIAQLIEFENLSNLKYDGHDPQAVRPMLETRKVVSEHSAVVIYGAINCMAQVNYLNDSSNLSSSIDLSVRKLKLDDTISDLRNSLKNLADWHNQIDEWKAYMNIVSCIKKPRGVIELISSLMHSSSDQACIQDCHLKKQVSIEVLMEKNILLFISNLDISLDDFSALEDVQKGLEKHAHFKIVWIPIVEKWDTVATKRFSGLIERMKWYTICYEKPIVGIKYIKKEWQFSYNPMVVVFNKEGERVCNDAIDMIRLWRSEAFPFNLERQEILIKEPDCLSVFFSYYLHIRQEVEKGSYIFFYGGDDKWIKTFRAQLDQLKGFAKGKFSMASFAIQKMQRQEDHDIAIGQFWAIMESIYYFKTRWGIQDSATEEIQKLISHKKDEQGWVLVYRKGKTSVTISTSGTVFVQALEEYLRKEPSPQQGFEIQLKIIIQRIKVPRTCYHLEMQSNSGWLPVEVKCPFCPAVLKRVVTYKCCHDELEEIGSR